jgi:heterodisulfide reductase subunit C
MSKRPIDHGEQKMRILFHGIPYDVPANRTVIQAMEEAGYFFTRGCGCRGGVCGACVMSYRLPGDHRLRTALACQTVVVDGMDVQQMHYFPATFENRSLNDLESRVNNLLLIYPELARCLGCYTCTKSCPQGIPMGEAMAAALRGDWDQAYDASFECLMCGMCTARCPAELSPHQILMVVRRLYGRDVLPVPDYLDERLDEIRSGKFNKELEELRLMDKEEILKLYQRYVEEFKQFKERAF